MLAEIEEGLGDESECGDFDEERGGPNVMAACDFHSLSQQEKKIFARCMKCRYHGERE